MVSPLEKIGKSRYNAACDSLRAQQIWMTELLERGLAEAREQPPEFWENRASRLVDDKLSGAARILRRIAALPPGREDWADIALSLLCELQVLSDAFLQLADLPEPLQHEVINRLGWSQKKKELADDPGVLDDWVVLGSRRREEDHLITDATWIFGRESRRFALELRFNPQHLHAKAPPTLPCGGCFRAEAVFYRGPRIQRIFFRNDQQTATVPVFLPEPLETFAEVCEDLAETLAENPLAVARPAFIRQIRVVQNARSAQISLRDQSGAEVRVDPEFGAPWRLLAAAGGEPVSVFGEWNGIFFTPLSLISSRRLINLDPQIL